MTQAIGLPKPTLPSEPSCGSLGGRGNSARPSPAHPMFLQSAPWEASSFPGSCGVSSPAWLEVLGRRTGEEEALPGISISQGKGEVTAVRAMISKCWTGDGLPLHPLSRSL